MGDSSIASDTRPIPSRQQVEPLVVEMLGASPVTWEPVREGGYSPAARWRIVCGDGQSAFVKAEIDSGRSMNLALEQKVYSTCEASCLPGFLGYVERDTGADSRIRVLAIEDLSTARWGAPLSDADADALSDALAELEQLTPPTGLPAMTLPERWERIAADPLRTTSTGLTSTGWIEAHAPVLAHAAASVQQQGRSLVHWDLWLQNWCRADRGAVLVDWSACGVANILVSRAWGEAGIRAAGGPPGRVLRGRPEWAAWMAGHTAEYLAGVPRDAPTRLHETLRREAAASLAWACEELDLPHPDPAPGFHSGWPWRP